jgi:hypothetical protein
VFDIYDSVEAARVRRWSWQTFGLVVSGVLLVVALVVGGMRWTPVNMAEPGLQGILQNKGTAQDTQQPLIELGKLVAAAAIGLLVTAVHRRYRREKPLSQSLEQAQVLLCVAGAMIMIIVGDQIARAFGILGIAGIVRFRTPVDDPKDMTIIFLLMGLGMASGIGAFAVAGLGTMFLCILLVLLDRVGARKPRTMMVEMQAEGREFPTTHVQTVFARNRVLFEPREVSQGKSTIVRYYTTLDPNTTLEDLGEQLLAGGAAGISSVSWSAPKKSE